MSDEETVEMEGVGPAVADGSSKMDEMLSSPSVSLLPIYRGRISQLPDCNKKLILKEPLSA